MEFRFPRGASVTAGGYAVVAQDPAALALEHAAAGAFGPWAGRLADGGDSVVLLDASGRLVDAVAYDDERPWPEEADGAGPSLELLDPALENDEPAAWGFGCPASPGRANSPAPPGGGDVVIAEIQYAPTKRRLLESLDPFWIGQGPYWETGDDPAGEYVELFHRGSEAADLSSWRLVDGQGVLFRFPPGTTLAPGGYLVVCRDAAEMARRHGIACAIGDFVPGGSLSDGGERLSLLDARRALVDTVRYADAPPWPAAPDETGASLECLDPHADNSVPANWRAARVPPRSPPAGALVGDEYSLDRGTPGRPNSRASGGVPPFVPANRIAHAPERPTSADDVVVSATPSGGDVGLAELRLDYEVYRAPYRAALASESAVLRDDGTGGDAVPGDGTFSAAIPAQPSQTLVRYRVVAEDALGRTWRYPDDAEPNPNRAYFVYDGEEDTACPAYFLLVPAASQAALDADIWTHEFYDATFVAEGIAYDHVGVHYRGRGWRVHPKKSWRIAFHKAEPFRGMTRLDLAMHFPVLQKLVHDIFWSAGHGNYASEVVRLYKDGSFGGLYLAQEAPNASWLRKHGMRDDGEIFKASAAPAFFPGGWSGTYVADLRWYADPAIYPKLYEKKGDPLGPFDALVDLTLKVSATPEADLPAVLSDELELDGWLYRWAIHVAGGHADIVGTNFTAIRPAEPRAKWRVLYHDFDLFFGCKGLDFVDVACAPHTLDPYLYVNRFGRRVSENPVLRARFLAILEDVLRHAMTEERVSAMVDAYLAATEGDREDELALGYGSPGPYVLSPPDGEELKTYFALRRDWLLGTWLPSQGFVAPANRHPTIRLEAPVADGAGIAIRWTCEDPEGDPATVDLYWTDRRWTHLEFIPGASHLDARSGSFRWSSPDERIGVGAIIHAVVRDGRSDLEGHGESPPLGSPPPPVLSPPGGMVDAPVRLEMAGPPGAEILYTLDGSDPRRVGGAVSPSARLYEGSILVAPGTSVEARSRIPIGAGLWSERVRAAFRASRVPLAVTEVMYASPGGSAGDFLEVHNYGTSPVDLRALSVADGVSFEFGRGDLPELEPGAYAVLVADRAAFRARYGEAGIAVAGQYEGSLSDRGERIWIADAGGDTVLEVTYRASWYPEASGAGRSLVLLDPSSPPETWSDAASWRPSAEEGGSPGRRDPASGGPEVLFVRGDANSDGRIDLADAVFSLSFQFLGGEAPACSATLDADGGGEVEVTDAVYVLGYLFLGGPAPARPFPSCGSDPGGLPCGAYPPCAGEGGSPGRAEPKKP